MIEAMLPDKPTFHAMELVRIFKGKIRGFTRPSVYRKLLLGQIESEYVNGYVIRRESVIEYFKKVESSH